MLVHSPHLQKRKVNQVREQKKRYEGNRPLYNANAAWSAVSPSSVLSMSLTICGFVLFSSSYPGVNIVGGKKICTLIPYSISSDWRVSARPAMIVEKLARMEKGSGTYLVKHA